MRNADGSEPFDSFLKFMQMWTPPMLAAPQRLSQPILSGWSLISVNEANSSAPDTEQAIVAKASYGRQLGKLIDAVEALIGERPPSAAQSPALESLRDLAAEVRDAKLDAARARFARLQSDLALLKEHQPSEFDRQRPALLALLGSG